MKAGIKNLLKSFHFLYLESRIISFLDTNQDLELTDPRHRGCQAHLFLAPQIPASLIQILST